MSRVLTSNLRDRKILTDQGLRIGELFDLEIDENTGKVKTLVVSPVSPEVAEGLSTDEQDRVLLPFDSVTAVRDYIVVSEKSLAVDKIKKRTST